MSRSTQAFLYGIGGGLAMGLMVSLMTIGSPDEAHLDSGKWVGYLRYLILFMGVLLCLKAVQKEKTPSPFWVLFRAGIIVSLSAGVTMGAFEIFHVHVLAPGFMEQFIEMSIDRLKEAGISKEELAQSIAQLRMLRDPSFLFFYHFIETAIFGTVFTLICAALFARKSKTNVE